MDVLVGANIGKSPVISRTTGISRGGRGEGRARGERCLIAWTNLVVYHF